jgi:hypothetical protein
VPEPSLAVTGGSTMHGSSSCSFWSHNAAATLCPVTTGPVAATSLIVPLAPSGATYLQQDRFCRQQENSLAPQSPEPWEATRMSNPWAFASVFLSFPGNCYGDSDLSIVIPCSRTASIPYAFKPSRLEHAVHVRLRHVCDDGAVRNRRRKAVQRSGPRLEILCSTKSHTRTQKVTIGAAS